MQQSPDARTPDADLSPGSDPTRVRRLTPEMCQIHLGTHDALHVTVTGERIYGGVYAVYAFPVAHRDGYICLMHSVGEGDDLEIGIIRDLADFPPDQADLVRQALARRYFMHTITRINEVGWRYGLVSMDVETDKGPARFMMRWSHDRAVDYGQRGKVLIDTSDNRYLIPDVDALPPRERTAFTRIIYW
ncbi:MAG: DUF1854 domain-containing protein [Phycisphaerae bacterium]|nr:DUF1854 domain-containing protein [Phycisphaerae bacterium]